jgi:hypothetical protein
MDQTELTGFIRSEAFHTGAIREAWKALIPSVLKGGRPYNPSQTASRHIVAERAREITDRLSTASEISLRSEMPFPGRLGVRVYLDKVLADPWTDDAVRNAVFDSLQKIEALGKSWLEGLGAVEPIELAGGPLVLVVDAVSPDVWLEAAGQMDLLQMDSPKKEEHVKERDLLSKVPGKRSTGWARLEAAPETAPATARLFGFQADPFDEFASRGISYIHFRGTEGRPLPDLLEPFTPGSAVVVRLSLLDQAAHTGTSRLGGMIVRLRELLGRELPPLAALCGEQKRPLILTTDHGLSLGRDGLKHGAGGVYERAIFRAQWNS